MDIKIISGILLIISGFVLFLGSLLRIYRKNLLDEIDKKLNEFKNILQHSH